MYSYKRLMIGLDFSVLDKTLIEYAASLSYYLKPEKIYFVNVQESLDMSDDLRERFPAFSQPRDEALKEEMKAEVEQYFPDHATYNTEFKVIEGSPRREMYRWVHIKNVDLLLVGRKKIVHGSGMIPQQLARKVPCSVLFVPEDAKLDVREILVSVDFSDCSKLAVEEAISVAKESPDTKVILQHVFTVPYGYSKTGKSEEEFAEIMKKHSLERYHSFMQDIDTQGIKVEPLFSYDHSRKSPARLINNVAHERKSDLIIIGARGRNVVTALFLGSVAEKLCRMDNDIPLLIVKRKDRSMSFMDMIESL